MLYPRAMVVVSIIVGILSFFSLVFLLKIPMKSAEDIGVLTIGVALAYMMMFYFIMKQQLSEEPTYTPEPG